MKLPLSGVVLPLRVLEFEGAEPLRPLRLFLGSENPVIHVLRFEHEGGI